MLKQYWKEERKKEQDDAVCVLVCVHVEMKQNNLTYLVC